MQNTSYKEALNRLFSISKCKDNLVIKPLLDSYDYILGEDIVCIRDLPAYNNSALDGYGVKYSDRGKTLKIRSEVIFAGVVIDEILTSGECYKIMTGAKIPDGVDTIVRFEDTKEINNTIFVPENIREADAFRYKGEECKIGSLLMRKGTRISASNIALLASQGISYVKVQEKLDILVLSTGNELKEPYEQASQNEFFNINAYTIISLLKKYGIDANYGGIILDSLEDTTKLFKDSKTYDVVISSGGVSAGEADFVKEALRLNGFISSFNSVNVKPGKPTVAGLMDDTLFISLPGNPLATFFNTLVFAVPAIKKLNGDINYEHKAIKAVNKSEFKVKSGRTNFVLGFYENGEFSVTDKGRISSGMVEPLLRSNCMLILSEDISVVSIDDVVDTYLF